MNNRITILIVGGYGTFGGRIVDLLKNESRLTLIVSGRSLDKAKQFCSLHENSAATLQPATFDRDGDLRAEFTKLQPDILIDASGPFQAYGVRPHALIEACIAYRINYLDLADGVEFVAGVGAFDQAAREVGVYVLSGVSTFPVLTAAVVRRLAAGMPRVDAICGGIAPSPYAGVGRNVIEAITSYAGKPIKLRRHGATATGYPLTEQIRYTIAVPGRIPLRNLTGQFHRMLTDS